MPSASPTSPSIHTPLPLLSLAIFFADKFRRVITGKGREISIHEGSWLRGRSEVKAAPGKTGGSKGNGLSKLIYRKKKKTRVGRAEVGSKNAINLAKGARGREAGAVRSEGKQVNLFRSVIKHPRLCYSIQSGAARSRDIAISGININANLCHFHS